MRFLQYIFTNKYFIIFFISLVFFISKWYPLLLGQKDLSIEFLFNYVGDGKYWIPYIKFISELNFNYSFDKNISDLDILPIPIGSLFIYSIFFKLFNLYGLVIIELFITFTFLLIFFKIFLQITNKTNSIIFSLLIFSFPEAVTFFEINNVYLDNLMNNFFSYRPHRPIFSNLFFYFGIFLLFKLFKDDDLNRKYFYIFCFTLGIIFSSFYYFFLILSISFLLIILNKKIFFKFIKNEYFSIIKGITFFLLASVPFIIILLTHEKDVSSSAGLIHLDIERKKILLEYYFKVFFNYKFSILFLIILFTFYFVKSYNKKENFVVIPYFIFLSSLISPILFFIISPNSGLIYHFNNNIVITAFLFFIFLIFFLISKKINLRNFYFQMILVFLIIFNVSSNIKSNLKNLKFIKTDKTISEFSLIINEINNDFKIKKDDIGLLTFDSNFMIWGILNDIKYFNILNHMWVPKKYELIENDLFNTFKFLSLKEDNVKKFFENRFEKWRYFNFNVGEIFGYRYQANSLTTKKNYDFSNNDIKNFILNSSPRFNQQIAIHNSELIRLMKNYKKSENIIYRDPEIIIINNKKNFLKDYKINE